MLDRFPEKAEVQAKTFKMNSRERDVSTSSSSEEHHKGSKSSESNDSSEKLQNFYHPQRYSNSKTVPDHVPFGASPPEVQNADMSESK